jgi:MoxR-like ATPase
MLGLGGRDGATAGAPERRQSYPAILCPTIVLRGQRAQIVVDGRRARRAVQCGRRTHGIVLLPAVDGVPLAAVTVGTLVEIEDEVHANTDSRSIAVFGTDLVNVTRVHPGWDLTVEATVRPHWTGDDPAWVDQVEALGAIVRYRAGALARVIGYKHRSYEALSLGQLVVDLADQLISSDSDRLRVLDADLLGQLRIVDGALRQRLKAGRGPRRRHPHSNPHESAPPQAVAAEELPADIQRAIDAESQRSESGWGSRTSEEAIRFIKGMKWVAPALPPVDLVSAKTKLDAACYGMEAVKEHLLDYLAAWEWSRQHGAERPGKVLCMVGPPGVGKTAIAEIVSEVMGRRLIRMPMAGVDDVFLIGADQAYQRGRPGEIARRIRESGQHPTELVFLLDEIDKVPDKTNSAVPVLLALLDREQQAHFRDHFLDAVNIDLSKSLIICTANNLADISPPLLDRLQPLVLPAYSRTEHILIGTQHLLPRLRRRLKLGDEVRLAAGVVPALVDRSPASPGMRQLQSQLETVLTRGLRLRLETGVSVVVSVEEALKWSAGAACDRRQIGFRASSTARGSTAAIAEDIELVGSPVAVTPGARAT